ncbi:MAG: phosphoenolpyruvate carboxykinase, partial [Desulfovibrio sp.]
FRVYELWKDVEAFIKVFENGASGYMFNSSGFWKTSADELTGIPLQTSLTLQTAILTDQLEWEDWPLLAGAQIPTRNSVEKLLPGFYERYDHTKVQNHEQYLATLRDRVEQRKAFLESSDLTEKPELLRQLLESMQTAC